MSKKIAIIGSGTMGRGIAHVSAAGGFETYLQDTVAPALNQAKEDIQKNLFKGVELGKMKKEEAEGSFNRIHFVSALTDIPRDTFLIIEAIPEDLDLKCDLFKKLDQSVDKPCCFATNTSALSIAKMADASMRPDRFIGMHFFNPVHKMKLVEIVVGPKTSEPTLRAALEAAHSMGKETVKIKESPGFVTTRMNALIGNEAFRMLEAGVASAEDIDRAVKLGLNHPMGPFEMIDLVGLDVRLAILRYLHQTLGELYHPSSLLEQFVKEGRLGRKSGRGVYTYESTGSAASKNS